MGTILLQSRPTSLLGLPGANPSLLPLGCLKEPKDARFPFLETGFDGMSEALEIGLFATKSAAEFTCSGGG
ncbi:hypothetical protein HanRHA438_Chr05g0242921 [Helianthus annuus]|nr:hypothetical protein HanRHA438_Chr05g0242921 [Helianthus annuus]